MEHTQQDSGTHTQKLLVLLHSLCCGNDYFFTAQNIFGSTTNKYIKNTHTKKQINNKKTNKQKLHITLHLRQSMG